MKQLSNGLAAHVASGATTLCWCWLLIRRDGARQGFTDHDRDIEFNDTMFEAAAGMTASEIRDTVGLSVDNLEVTSAMTSERLSEADLAAGLYDNASVEIYRVNWVAPEQRVLMRSGNLGEVKRSGSAFAAEVRGLAHALGETKGRLFQYACDADLGDQRCTINLDNPLLRGEGALVEVTSPRRFTVSGLDAFESGWFTHGLLSFTSGAAEGQAVEIKKHTKAGGLVSIELWSRARLPLEPDQTFTVTAGCDKRVGTCRTKFANVVNFRGFPHMPGNDLLTVVSRPGSASR
ncbi:DUF2163 domain-containing protein [Hyphomicrobium sp.]|uniref:DUF2163 domain-containing protein n=1 Tax=Hyphomicrobium sp. TaxID=82 RepID=UPI002E377858|nr:DUF2163 domain-containing protein [Hyphomicrobium sp.]HEX2843310.1 DUF2163 domain-containing protein [Hyphomicrobium sp.]